MIGRPPLARSFLWKFTTAMLFMTALLTTLTLQAEEAQAICFDGFNVYNTGARICSGNRVRRCRTFGWRTVVTCTHGCTTSSGSPSCRCPSGYPSPGTGYTCTSGALRICNASTNSNGNYSSVNCTYGCYTSGTTPYCRCQGNRTGGQVFCSNATTLRRCEYSTATGGSITTIGCNAGQSCTGNQCVTLGCTFNGNQYSNGQSFCSGNTRYTCNGNNNVTAHNTCGYGCYTVGNAAFCKCIGGTTGGQFFCASSTNRLQCQHSPSNFGYGVTAPCPSGQTCTGAGTCTACTCTPGVTKRCSPNGSGIEVCAANCISWQPDTSCPSGQYCNNNQCIPCACSPGAIRCSANKVEVCLNSCAGWTTQQTCSANEYCVNGACAGCVCTAGATQCNGNNVEKCDVDCQRWYPLKTCSAQNNTVCLNGNCSQCTCTVGAKRCASSGNGDIEECQADCNTWAPSSTTPSCSSSNNQYCSNGKCSTCACTPNAKQCVGPNVQICKADCSGWQQQPTCPSGQYCFNGQCSNCKCAAGSTRCNGLIVEKCDASCQNWTTVTTCGAGQKCANANNTTSCRALNWCPYVPATKATQCNNKVCLSNVCTPYECPVANMNHPQPDTFCAQGQVCNLQKGTCENATCSYNSSIGVFHPACLAKTPTKQFCALYQCRECRYDYTTGQIAAECQNTHTDRPYCAEYGCRECPTKAFTQDSSCVNINSGYQYCVNYKCAQCPSVWNPSDTQYCGGNPCKDYFCSKCNNASKTPQYNSQCATNSPGQPYCSEYKCVECPETNSSSGICQGRYVSKPFCNANNVCVQCPGAGFSSFCQTSFGKDYCFEGKCEECGSSTMSRDDATCKAKYPGNSKPHCYRYNCVECPEDNTEGTYDRDFCVAKYGGTSNDKRYCAANVCVQCPHKVAQRTTACPPNKSICSNYTCRECETNKDCPIGQTCQANTCVAPTQQCGNCQDDSWCQANTTAGANCGVGKNRCDPKSNTCVHCLVDADCGTGKTCDLTSNTCVTSNCPGFCTTAADCQKSDCGTKTACIKSKCVDPGPGSTCVQPNIMLQIDQSGSMTSISVDTKQPCSSPAACVTYFSTGIVPSYTLTYGVQCSPSASVGLNTCKASRWDVAMSALRKVVYDFGGTAALNWQDRKVRWGLAFFHSLSSIPGGNTAPANKANWGGLSDVPNTQFLLNSMQLSSAGGGTRYDNAFSRVENHLIATIASDAIPSRKTAVIFCTDGAPNEGCTASPPIVNRIYNLNDRNGQPLKIKSYIVGFGSGLGTGAQACLATLATNGRSTPTVCNSGACLGYFAADSAADLANALQEIINQATQEVCDGLDNDCDGLIDNNTVDACSCVMSFSRPTPTTSVNPLTTDFRAGVRLYTFVASFDISGTCPTTDSQADKDRKLYMEACRNQAIKATQCTPAKDQQIHPAGDSYKFYVNRCCGNGTATNTCSWPTQHACELKPWGGNCQTNLTAFCKDKKESALNCMMPRGILIRSGTGYDSQGNLTVLTVKDIGVDTLNKQPKRSIFVHVPGRDYRTIADPDNRPLIANVQPDDYAAPTFSGTTFSAVTTEHQFDPSNVNLTTTRLGIDNTHCTTTADCNKDRADLIWFVLGYDGTGSNTRTNRLGAIYHSTPAVASPVRATIPDPAFEAWVQEKQFAGSFSDKTVRDRPSIVYVGSADGIMHAFNVNTGLELWGYIPRYFLEANPRDTLREAVNGARTDGTRVHMVDGSPIVQDVQMYRRVDTNGNIEAKWRTVLLFGLRSGGRAYVAIDVTNPYKPKLLWEISKASNKLPSNTSFGTFDKMGLTYGEPHIANVLINYKGILQERAVAFLPGGIELKRAQLNATWELDYNSTQGSVVYAVDLESGEYLTELSTRHTTTNCTGGNVVIERGVAAAPVGYNVIPALTTRIFFGDMHGNIFRANLESQNPSTWQATKFISLFKPCETQRPIMTSPSIALNEKGEVVIYGGTGDLENIDDPNGFNKIFSIREGLTTNASNQLVAEPLPNYIFKLDKFVKDELTNALGSGEKQEDSTSITGERLTGAPVIFGGTAYFTTYTTQPSVPVCGVRGFGRLYGIHFNDGCRTENCANLRAGSSSNSSVTHFYHKVAGYVNNGGSLTNSRTPMKACEDDNVFNSGSSIPPTDPKIRNGVQLGTIVCGDLNFTIPMLQDTTTTAPYEYYRYLAMGENTLAMGATFAYQPGETDITRSTNPNTGDSYHRFNTKRAGSQYLTFQVAGKNPAANTSWRLEKLRAVQVPAQSQQKGAFSTVGAANTFSPISLFSWGRVLD